MKNYLTILLFVISLTLGGCGPHAGLIKYDPTGREGMHEKELGQNASIAILDFPDRRHDSGGKGNLIGTVYGGFKNPLKRIYSHQTINLDVMGALENLFRANGFLVKKYPGTLDYSNLSNERLAVKGHINKFWTESYYSIGAVVDVYIEIFDRKYERIIWSGKIQDYQKSGMGGGVFTDANDMVLFLNQVLSNAIEKTWTEKGMLNALKNLKKE